MSSDHSSEIDSHKGKWRELKTRGQHGFCDWKWENDNKTYASLMESLYEIMKQRKHAT